MTWKRRAAVLATAVLATAVPVGAVLALGGCTDPTAPALDPDDQPRAVAPVEVPWAWELTACVAYRHADYQSPAHRLQAQTRVAADTIEHVETYEPGWGEQAMAEIREVLNECGSYEAGGSGDPDAFREQYFIVESGFAGDESLLIEVIRQQPPELDISYAVVVRRGERVVTVRGPEEAVERATCLAVLATCPAGQA